MGENEIPFPLLSGQYVYANADGTKRYYEIVRQPRYFDLTVPYEIPPSTTITDQTITNGTGSGEISVFRTKVPGLKEWVTWIDNDYLEVSWTIDSVRINSLSGYSRPETKYTSPFGGMNFPKFILNNAAGNVTFDLTNTSPGKYIAGTMHVIMYEYVIKAITEAPAQATNVTYVTGEVS